MPRYYKKKIYSPEQLGYLKGVNEVKAEQRLIEATILGNTQVASIVKQKVAVANARMKNYNDKTKI